jgi:uncharacterized membrane protein
MRSFITTLVFMLVVASNAFAQPLVDCNKASSMAAAGVFKLYQGTDLKTVVSLLPEAAEKANLNAAELIVATGIVANVNSQGVKELYQSLTDKKLSDKIASTRNAFYLFCKDSFEEKKYY